MKTTALIGMVMALGAGTEGAPLPKMFRPPKEKPPHPDSDERIKRAEEKRNRKAFTHMRQAGHFYNCAHYAVYGATVDVGTRAEPNLQHREHLPCTCRATPEGARLAELLNRFGFLSSYAARDAAEEAEVLGLDDQLRAERIHPGWPIR